MEKKVNIICHRGFWKKKSEQNKIISIKKAIDKYYGIEIDLRDSNNEIIISHDPHLSGKKLNFKIINQIKSKLFTSGVFCFLKTEV